MSRKTYKVIYLGGPLNNEIRTLNTLQRTFVFYKTETPKSPGSYAATYKLLDSSAEDKVLYRYKLVAIR